MRITYISHQKEDSGYGRYCREFLKALKTTKHDIGSFAVTLGKVGNFEDETEKNNLYNPDLVIQNILPHLMSKGNFKCIGGAILESEDVKYNYWDSHLNMMDEVWYPHHPLGLYNQEREIPTPLDIDKYTKKYPKLNITELNGTYKFYWIGELSKRKNLSGLIKAYYTAFSSSDPVSLVIKAHKPSFSSQDCNNEVSELIKTITYGMKLYNTFDDYPRIIVIPEFWSEEQIYSLHQYCDCFVSSSHGESINYPLLDSLGFNKTAISTSTFSTESYFKYGQIELVVSDNKEQCFGQVDTFPWYQTSLESWNSFNLNGFVKKMQTVYENRKKSKNDLSPLSYNNIGIKINEELNRNY